MIELEETACMLQSSLESAGIDARRFKKEELTGFVYRYLNPSRSALLPASPVRSDQTLRSQMALNACQSEFDLIYLDGFYYRAVNLHTRPETVFFQDLLAFLDSLTPEFYFCFTVHIGSQERTLKQVHSIATQAKNIMVMHTIKRYHEAEKKAEAADQMIEHVTETFQKVFQVSMAVVIQETTPGKLTLKTNEAVQYFRKMSEAEGVIDDMNHLPLFLSMLPNHSHLNFRKFFMHTDAVCQVLPLSAPWRGSKTPKILFQTADQELMPVDLFDPSLEAKHGLILGSTGSGKSFTCNYLLTNFLIESDKNHIVIVDVGGSYRKLCDTFQGQYLQIELSEKFAFNPFLPKELAVIGCHSHENGNPEVFEIDPDVISYLTLLVQKMLNLKQITGRQSTILENAITRTYQFAPTDPPLLSALHAQLENYKGDPKDQEIAQEFAKNMEIWVSGRYGKLMNRPQSMTIHARLVVFDLQKLDEQPELQGVIFFVIKNVIQAKLKDLSLKKMIVIDEGWKFFNDEVGAKLIMDLYRTARKFNGAVYSISQNPSDFLKTAAADSMIGNSSIKYILKIKTGHELLSQFRLNETEVEDVKELRISKGKFSEVFLKFGEHARVIRISPSPMDYWICTTDPDDTKTEQKLRSEHPEFTTEQLLTELAKLRGYNS
jgi:conjugal transfer ATP-binding protein TraC